MITKGRFGIVKITQGQYAGFFGRYLSDNAIVGKANVDLNGMRKIVTLQYAWLEWADVESADYWKALYLGAPTAQLNSEIRRRRRRLGK